MEYALAKEMIRSLKETQKLRKNSNRKSHEVLIDEQDLMGIFRNQEGRCYYSGVKFNMEYSNHFRKYPYHPLTISLERLDADVGYVAENVVLTLRLFNLGRNACDLDTFKSAVSELREGLNA